MSTTVRPRRGTGRIADLQTDLALATVARLALDELTKRQPKVAAFAASAQLLASGDAVLVAELNTVSSSRADDAPASGE